MGLEPTTQWLTAICSTSWATSEKSKPFIKFFFNISIRFLITIYRGWDLNPHTARHLVLSQTCLPVPPPRLIYCGGRNWTYDLRVMSPARYHFSTPQQTGMVGLEPTNAGFKVQCLTSLATSQQIAGDETRTRNILLGRQML